MVWQVARLVVDEDGGDLIEYALIAALIGMATVVGMDTLETAMNAAYGSWDTTNHGLWQPPPPQ
jgi:pilus assembly protein Flp/PilA